RGRGFELGDEKVAFTELRADGPTGTRIAIHGVLGPIILLLPIGARASEDQVGVASGGAGGSRSAGRPIRGRGRDGPGREFVEDEVARFVPTSWTFLGQARVGQ